MVETYIITPNYNGERFLEKYFSSVLKQSYRNFTIIFVENSENNISIEYIEQKYQKELEEGKIKIINNKENYGFAKANNQGIIQAMKDSDARYIVCLNNDTEAEEDFLKNLVAMSKNYPKSGSIQAKMILGSKKDLIDSVGTEYSKKGIGFCKGSHESIKNHTKEEEIMGCVAGACLYKIDALKDIVIDGEYFDEDFFAYYEDTDLALRLRWAGWNSYYCPDAVVFHYLSGTMGIFSSFQTYHLSRNYVWTLYKNLPNSYIIKRLPHLFITEIMLIIFYLSKGQPIVFKAKFNGYTNLKKFLKKKKKINKKIEFSELEKWFIGRWY